MRRRFGPHGRLEQQVADEAQERGREAEARDRVGRHLAEAARQHRIAGPHESRHEGAEVAGQVFGPRVEARRVRRSARRRRQSREALRQMRAPQMLSRQQRGEQHDEKRPEIVDRARIPPAAPGAGPRNRERGSRTGPPMPSAQTAGFCRERSKPCGRTIQLATPDERRRSGRSWRRAGTAGLSRWPR